MAAMDIRFVDAAAEDPAQAEEIEPDAEMGQVFVKIDAQALIPEDVDESTLAVQHHAKVSDGGIFGTGIFEHTDVVVETVADNTEETGDITAVPDETALPETLPALADEPEMAEAATLEEPAAETEETQPAAMNVEAEFAVNSFSKFTITWRQNSVTATIITQSGEEITVEGWPRDGKEIAASTSWVSIGDILEDVGLGNTITAQDGTKYQFVVARTQRSSGSEIKWIKYKDSRPNQGWRYSSYDNKPNGDGNSLSAVYLVYTELPGTAPTVDTKTKGITINMFDYSATGTYAGINSNHTLKFNGTSSGISNDGTAWNSYTGSSAVRLDILQAKLQKDADTGIWYPVLQVGNRESLKYLFDGTNIANATLF